MVVSKVSATILN